MPVTSNIKLVDRQLGLTTPVQALGKFSSVNEFCMIWRSACLGRWALSAAVNTDSEWDLVSGNCTWLKFQHMSTGVRILSPNLFVCVMVLSHITC